MRDDVFVAFEVGLGLAQHSEWGLAPGSELSVLGRVDDDVAIELRGELVSDNICPDAITVAYGHLVLGDDCGQEEGMKHRPLCFGHGSSGTGEAVD